MKIATKLTKRVAEFVNEKYRRNFHADESDYIHFDREQVVYMFSNPLNGYTHVSEQEFIDMVTAELKPKEMKTKCIVLGQENEPVKELKKIEFVSFIGETKIMDAKSKPTEFDIIELISRDYNKFDLMFAYHESDGRSSGTAYLGHWNDGIV